MDFQGNLLAKPHLPIELHGAPALHTLQHAAILDRTLVKHNNRVAVHYLIPWEGQPEFDSTRDDAKALETRFPEFFWHLQP